MSKKRKNRKKHMGSSIDDFLKEEGLFEEAQTQAIKEVVAWQITLSSLQRAAAIVGRRVTIELA
jgi:hypothetical protein